MASRQAERHDVTPDGRYFVVRGRLWRMADPRLSVECRASSVAELMGARRDIAFAKRCNDEDAIRDARRRVDRATQALGERGPVWWDDGAPDLNRHMVRNTAYADWLEMRCDEGLRHRS